MNGEIIDRGELSFDVQGAKFLIRWTLSYGGKDMYRIVAELYDVNTHLKFIKTRNKMKRKTLMVHREVPPFGNIDGVACTEDQPIQEWVEDICDSLKDVAHKKEDALRVSVEV